MELTKIQRYKMTRTRDLPNIREIIGETVHVSAELLTEYTDPDGEIHKVLSLLTDRGYYKTEVAAFIEAFAEFVEVFGDERPAITITGKTSKRGNPYVNFEIVE